MIESKYIKNFRSKAHFYYSHKGEILRVNLDINYEKINEPENELTINNLLNKFGKILINYKRDNDLQNPPIEFVRLHLFNPDKVINRKDLKSLYDSFYTSLTDDKTIQPQSLKPYFYLKDDIDNFIKSSKEKDLYIINQKLFDSFINYIKDPELKLAINTIRKKVSYFKRFCNYLKRNNFIDFIPQFNKLKFNSDVKAKEIKQVITLTKEELKYAVDQFEVETNIRYRKTLAMFLFSCFTSLRFSDIEQIHPDNKDIHIDLEKKVINLTIKKTGVNINLKLNDFLIKILEEFDYSLNHYQTAQYIQNIREVFKNYSEKVPSLKEQTTRILKMSVGSKKTTKMKYEFFGSHTGRRCFISFQIGLGTNFIDIMNLTGHTDIKLLNEYLDLYNKEKSGENINVSTTMLNFINS